MSLKLQILSHQQRCTELLNNTDFFLAYDKLLNETAARLKLGGHIYLAGNGGSFADALHLAGELNGKIYKDRKPIPTHVLGSDLGTLTCISNDYGYEKAFARELQGKINYNDVFIGITTSGNSTNILNAFTVCTGLKVLLCGNNGGKALNLCDIVLNVPGTTADEIQQLHEIVYHSFVYDLEQLLFKET